MIVDVVSIFPNMFAGPLSTSIVGLAQERGLLEVRCHDLREWTHDRHRSTDDSPYGGGPGMVMLAEPLTLCLEALRGDRTACGAPDAPTVLFSPVGEVLSHASVEGWSAGGSGAVLICGRYEGLDQRFVDAHVTQEISLGDFVLSGGEVPALALLDAVARLQDGVLTAPSHEQDSFSDGLLEGPHYSRPEKLVIDGRACDVPAVLLSGHHGDIAHWRRQRSLERTAQRRPDLIAAARAAGLLSPADERYLDGLGL